MAAEGKASVYTDAVASPTGFPFKVALLEKTMSEEDVYLTRTRICDLGYLRELAINTAPIKIALGIDLFGEPSAK